MEKYYKCKNLLGFGLMRLPMLNEVVDIQQVKQMVDYFMEHGFNYFDTAHGYINGLSELAFKEAVAKRYPREDFVVTDKLSGPFFNTEADLESLFQSQLEACGVDYFDFYLMHAQNAKEFIKFKQANAYEFAFNKKKEGKVKHVGLSFHDSAVVLENILTEYPEIDVVQIQLNYVDYDDPTIQAKKIYDVCQKFHKKIIIMEPVKGGHLVNLPTEALNIIASNYQGSPASLAIRFAASHQDVIMVLSGMSTFAQMQDNVSYMKDFKPLNENEYQLIKQVTKIYKNSQLVPCTNCRYCVSGCPKKILIPDLIAILNQKQVYDDWTADEKYQTFTANASKASDCIACGKCEKICPQHLEIRKLLELIVRKFEH